MSKNNEIYDLIIIGAGPAGLSASIYASKANLKTLILEKEFPGGKIAKTSFIENWPGIKRVDGFELATDMYNHAISYGSYYEQGEVLDINNKDDLKEVVCKNKTYLTKALIIATGTKERKIGIPGEDEFYGKGVSYCAVCDGSLYKDEEMVVIGGGNSALQETLYLTNFASKIYIVHRRYEFRAEISLIEKIKNHPKVELLLNYIPISINGDKGVESITLENNKTKEKKIIKTNVIFPFIGSNPESEFVKKLNICDEKGNIIVNERMQTSIDGIFGAGDVLNKNLRQIVTAVNDGAIAAMNAYEYIKNKTQ